MFDYKKKSVMVVLVMILTVCVLLCACGKDAAEIVTTEATQAVETTQAVTEAAVRKALSVESIEEKEDVMVVTTSFGQLKFPFAFGDLIQVKAVNDTAVASLEFSALISGEEYPVFAVRFGSSEGIVLGTMEIPGEADPRTVTAELYSADEAALAEKINTYYAAQETFNDVVASLRENQGFSSAE